MCFKYVIWMQAAALLGISAAELSHVPAPPSLSSVPYPEGIADEAAFRSWLEREQTRLFQAAGAAPVQERLRLQLQLANWLLAVRCEPHASRLIQNVAEPDDAAELSRLSGEALRILGEADPDHEDERWGEVAELLAHFGEAMRQYALAHQSAHDPEALQNAANDLAMWLDDERLPVASAAVLWQSLLYQAAGEPERALAVLPLPLTALQDDPFAFFARLQRCLVLARTERRSAALALLLRMEERTGQWFRQPSESQSALCTLTWARIQMAETADWALGDVASTTMSRWIERAREALANNGETCELLRLTHAVPLLISEAAATGKAPAAVPPGGNKPPRATPGAPDPDAGGRPTTEPAERQEQPD